MKKPVKEKVRSGIKVRTGIHGGGIDPTGSQHNRRLLTPKKLRKALASLIKTFAEPVRRGLEVGRA